MNSDMPYSIEKRIADYHAVKPWKSAIGRDKDGIAFW